MTPATALEILSNATQPAEIRGPITREGYVQIHAALQILAQEQARAAGLDAKITELTAALVESKTALEALAAENGGVGVPPAS